MKLYCLKEDALDFYKSNTARIVNCFTKIDNQLLLNVYEDDPFVETKYEIDDFELDMSMDDYVLTDLENVKRVYGNLRFLSDSQAGEERLWAGLAIHDFWKYMQYRWGKEINANKIDARYFFKKKYSIRRAALRQGIARLWWIGRLTFDPEKENVWEITEFVCNKQDIISSILERNQSNNISITKEIMQALMENEKNGGEIDRETVRTVAKYVNSLGGAYVIDCMPDGLIYRKVLKKLGSIRNEG